MKTINKNNNFFLAASIALAFALTPSAFAGFYFDIGMGLGLGWTTATWEEDYYYYNYSPYSEEYNYTGLGYEYGLKMGGGPSNVGSGLFIVGELSMAFPQYDIDRLEDFSLMTGPGVVFYPIKNLQIGSSFGFCLESKLPGYAYNLSVAYDVGNRNNGLLLGLKYYGSNVEDSGYRKTESSMISTFIRYVYRKRGVSIADEEPKKPKQVKQAVLYDPNPEPAFVNPQYQQKPQSAIRNFAVKNFDEIEKNNQKGKGEHLNSLILLMESEGTPKDEALLLIKRALRKSNGNAEAFANELENSASLD